MKINEKCKKNKPLISFEIFPPKKDGNREQIYNTLKEISVYNPDFISVTYGATGSERGVETVEISEHIKNTFGIDPLTHITCAGATKEEVDEILKDLNKRGIENTLLMRGDKRENLSEDEQFPAFKYASELIEYARNNFDFGIGGACYPEGHMESKDSKEDLINLKNKVDCGADFLITQFFFDNQKFYDFVKNVRNIGINVPIFAGIMPVLNKNQIQKMISLSGATIPLEFEELLNRYQDDENKLREVGMEYAIKQVRELLLNGVDGIHLYVMNRPIVAQKIFEGIADIYPELRK